MSVHKWRVHGVRQPPRPDTRAGIVPKKILKPNTRVEWVRMPAGHYEIHYFRMNKDVRARPILTFLTFFSIISGV